MVFLQEFPQELFGDDGRFVFLFPVRITVSCHFRGIGIDPARHDGRGQIEVKTGDLRKHGADDLHLFERIIGFHRGADRVAGETADTGQVGFHCRFHIPFYSFYG